MDKLICPKHGKRKRAALTQGDELLGYLWVCPDHIQDCNWLDDDEVCPASGTADPLEKKRPPNGERFRLGNPNPSFT